MSDIKSCLIKHITRIEAEFAESCRADECDPWRLPSWQPQGRETNSAKTAQLWRELLVLRVRYAAMFPLPHTALG